MPHRTPKDYRVGSYNGHVFCSTQLHDDDARLVTKTLDAAFALLEAVNQALGDDKIRQASNHHYTMIHASSKQLEAYHKRLETHGKEAIAAGVRTTPDCPHCREHGHGHAKGGH
ncbi:MAG: hypothetical protein A2V88_09290 [Elusimicrobia bacterium RBG_16_66_12]|nr:MAG: hypothetical protein A2V88_09290 [Elusimicrobia bacterium RBG_16_66_12]